MMNFEINDLVMSREFGNGQVIGFDTLENGRDVVIVNFEREGKKKLELGQVKLQKITQAYLDDKKLNHQNWPHGTFVYESEQQTHAMASHWHAFCDNQEVFDELPVLMPKASNLQSYGNFFQSPLAGRDVAPSCYQLVTPNHEMGLSLVVESQASENVARSAFPYCKKGMQNSLMLNEVSIWSGQFEAHIHATWGDAEICFFDTHFIHNRAWYVALEMYEFILTGIAYYAEPAEAMMFTINHRPEEVNQLIEIGAIEKPEDLSDVVDMSQAAIFLPIPEWDKDDYQFQGKIKELKSFDDFLGQSGWIATVTVIKNLDDDTDQDLKIVITRKIWKADTAPTVGEFIQGRLWLQGHLWNVTNKHHFK